MNHASVKYYFKKDEQVVEYLDARDTFLKLDKKVDDLAAKISNVGHTLLNWRSMFLFSDCKTNLPAVFLRDLQDKNYSASNWPTAKQINDVLAVWHTSRNRQKQLWKKIPLELRKNLESPF